MTSVSLFDLREYSCDPNIPIDNPLAVGFSIMRARHEVRLPRTVKPGRDYQIVGKWDLKDEIQVYGSDHLFS